MDFSRIVETGVVIICVPTPLSKNREPDLRFVVNATPVDRAIPSPTNEGIQPRIAVADPSPPVGADVAGLMTALYLAPEPAVLLSSAPLGCEASGTLAQGGLAASLGAEDSVDLHPFSSPNSL
ncbi:UDP-glucose/GDP-mannose dehydrogenase family, NAD binding domain [Mesorhizobium albiziae]|uniref:UDP-glucose/GDP-mannose dehydrogenase family, NAD binding domain n=1 Tax=Neomesorhizobium albiziae TaxID=335020 RepID=A0A1I4F0W6_9HYPH|nr:hypothetical protein GCM10007937_48240 [Mesorhizobium albiziae]SFL11073.1 UDP-glucose/GDP-mannose dehydrogenase family, NAD binding domain [Mesorhizobium albiziae]